MSMSANIHGATVANHNSLSGVRNDGLEFKNADGGSVMVFVPPHAARATAEAFNRAMQVKMGKAGLTYKTISGLWYVEQIRNDIWHGQYEEITGDGDPEWMTVDAKSLEALQDAIDEIVQDHHCTDCHALVGEDRLTETENGAGFLCSDCIEQNAKHAAGLAEMAGDDKAHAHRERELGL